MLKRSIFLLDNHIGCFILYSADWFNLGLNTLIECYVLSIYLVYILIAYKGYYTQFIFTSL